jgi:anaerobic selenocysteine-containing dehydrogenase
MNMQLSRRQFMKGAGAGMAGTTLGAFGFGNVEAAHAAAIRPFKLVGTTETRNTCPYCSVACGVIMYSKGDLLRASRLRSPTSRAMSIIPPIAARSARRVRRSSISCVPLPA